MSEIELKYSGITYPGNYDGPISLGENEGGFFQICCDCGLGHKVLTDGKRFEFERVEFGESPGVPANVKFPIRESLKEKDAKILSLEKELSEAKQTVERMRSALKKIAGLSSQVNRFVDDYGYIAQQSLADRGEG